MSHMLQLVGSQELLDFYSDFRVRADGVDMGHPAQRPRVITIPLVRDGTQATFDGFRDGFTKLRRLLHEARDARAAGLGRVVSLEARPDGAGALTTYYVLGGDFPEPPAWQYRHHTQRIADVDLALEVEPYGFGAEALVSPGSPILSVPYLTYRYLNDGGVFTPNLAGLASGSLWQTTRLIENPAGVTTTTPAAGDVLYFGRPQGGFLSLVFGLETPAAGITWGNWEYWDGAAWTTLSTITQNDFKTVSEFDTARRLGRIAWTTVLNNTTAVNGVTAYWVRIAVSAVSSPTAPRFINGPFRSPAAITIADSAVDGDVPAAGRIEVRNNQASALAGIRAALASGLLGSAPPPFGLSVFGADAFVPAAGGDNTVAATPDTEATIGERLQVLLAPGLSDAAQAFDGSTQNATVAITSGDKIDSIGSGSFFVEVGFVLDDDSTDPMCLMSRWSTTAGLRVFWLGVDQGRLRAMVSVDGTKRRVVNGSRRLGPGRHYMATLEFNSPNRKLVLYLDSRREGATDVKSRTIRTGQTTALRLAKSQGFTSTESRNGQDAEVHFDGAIDWAMIHASTVKDYASEVLGTEGNYTFPDDPSSETKRADHAETRGLWQCDDNAASTTIADTATAFNGTTRNLARTGNTNANRRPGVLNVGVGSFGRVLGGNLPQCLLEEFAGTYRFILMAKQGTTLSALDDVQFQLQLNVGDGQLRMGPPAMFPALTAPPSSGFYPLDLGTFTLPGVGLYEGHRGSGSAANFAQWSLFVRHKFTAQTLMGLDNLYILPTGDWYGEYDAFDDRYESAYALAQSERAVWDSLGPEPLIYQAADATNPLRQERNPYAAPSGAAPRFRPRKASYLYAFGLRGDATTDSLYRVLADWVVPVVTIRPRWRGLAGS
jgi:hypothetical protein